MKLRKIRFENHPFFGTLDIDFTNNDATVDTIIIAGENGCGKSQLLNTIYLTDGFNVSQDMRNEKRYFEIELSEEEVYLLSQPMPNNVSAPISQAIKNRIIYVDLDYNIVGTWDHLKITYSNDIGNVISIKSHMFSHSRYKKITNIIFSDTEINYNPNNIANVSSTRIDTYDCKANLRSNSNLATEIAQLLVDINSQDASELQSWCSNNPGKSPPSSMINPKMERFTKAYNQMFSYKKFKGVRTNNNSQEVIFEEFGYETTLSQLSSGEKQIVFRGGFLLKEIKNITGSLVLIDEPELSLHPAWQLKILDYYKNIFTDQVTGIQTSQLIVVTHSPFLIHNHNRCNDKVIILKKDNFGKVIVSDKPEFYTVGSLELVKEAFNFNFAEFSTNKPLIVTEGKTDWKHLKAALQRFKQEGKYESLDIEFHEEANIDGASDLENHLKQLAKRENKSPIIGVFDRDIPGIIKDIGDGKSYGNNVFAFCIPIPNHRANYENISIEFYYKDDEIKTQLSCGTRLFFDNECQISSLVCNQKTPEYVVLDEPVQECEYTKKIFDKDLHKTLNKKDNIGHSKEVFASNVLAGEFTTKFGIDEFGKIFDIIKNKKI